MFQLCDRAVFQGLWENFQEKKFMGKKERGKTKKTRKNVKGKKKEVNIVGMVDKKLEIGSKKVILFNIFKLDMGNSIENYTPLQHNQSRCIELRLYLKIGVSS